MSRNRHVLTGSKSNRGRGDQASLAVDNEGHEAGTIHFLQAADKKLEINDRSDHSPKTIAVHDGRADQQHGSG